MKLRTDFITNSSSSSYIIGKSSDKSVTKDSVYQIIRDLYCELEHIREDFDHIVSGIDYIAAERLEDESDGVGDTFIMTRDDKQVTIDSSSPFFKALSDLIIRYDIHSTSFVAQDAMSIWWNQCKTYEEFELFYSVMDIKTPFDITDLAVDNIMYTALGKDTVNHESDTLSHFTNGLVYTAYKTLDMDCNACRLNGGKCEHQWKCSQFSEDDFTKIEAYKTRIRIENLPKERACLHFLGRVCIQSFEGDIPEWISYKLEEMSEYSDIHW